MRYNFPLVIHIDALSDELHAICSIYDVQHTRKPPISRHSSFAKPSDQGAMQCPYEDN